MKLKEILNKVLSMHWMIFIFLVSLIYIFDPRYLTSPPLYVDDWTSLIERSVFDGFRYVDFTSRRPFVQILLALLKPIFGLKIQLYYLLNFLFIFAIGILFYLIIKRAFPDHAWMHLPIVLIFLVYPIDFTKTWLVLLTARFVLIFYLAIVLLLHEFAHTGKLWSLVFAHLLFLFSLGIYEAGFGAILLTSIMLVVKYRKTSRTRSLGLLSVFISGFLFFIWRMLIQPRFFNIQDQYLNKFNTSIPTIVFRYLKAFFIAVFDWFEPLLHGFGTAKYYGFIAFGIIMVGAFIAFLPRIFNNAKSSKLFNWGDRKVIIRSLLMIVVVGGLSWAAGYIPVIGLSGLAFEGLDTRYNLFAIPGASIAFVAGISLLVTLFVKSKERIGSLTLTIVLPFIVVGLVYQAWSQNERFKAWDIQKHFWNGMLQAVPGLADDSTVGIVITDYQELDQYEFLPLAGNWEGTAAIRVLYNNPDLTAFYFYPDRPATGSNLVPPIKDWSHYIIVLYDTEKNIVEVMSHPEDMMSLQSPLIGYQPEERMVSLQQNTLIYRWLVK